MGNEADDTGREIVVTWLYTPLAVSLGRIYSIFLGRHVCSASHRWKTDSLFGRRGPSIDEFWMPFNIYKFIVARMGDFVQLGRIFGFTCMTCPIPDLGLGDPSSGPWILRPQSRARIYQRSRIIAGWRWYLRPICVRKWQKGPRLRKQTLWHGSDNSIRIRPDPIPSQK